MYSRKVPGATPEVVSAPSVVISDPRGDAKHGRTFSVFGSSRVLGEALGQQHTMCPWTTSMKHEASLNSPVQHDAFLDRHWSMTQDEF